MASIKAQYSGPADVPVTTTKAKHVADRDTAPVTKELYLAEITIPSYGLNNGVGGGAPYNVLVFLGDVPTEAKDWQNAESFVGLASTLGAAGLQVDQTTTHTIDLSLAVQKAFESSEASESKVKEYLKENLHYRVGLVSNALPCTCSMSYLPRF